MSFKPQQSYSKQELIEFTRTIQDRCRVAAFGAISNAGIDYEDMVKLELEYDNQISISIDEDELHNEIEIAIDDVFETDDDAVYEEIMDVIKYIVEYRKV